jgi:tetratricopeptide (TPR) repeat protein
VEWRLSIGGMSRVYRGTHLPSGLPIAVKVLFPSEAPIYQALISSFEREVAATRRLKHPHVVEVYDAGVTPRDERYLIMELLNGEDVADRLDRGILKIDEALELADQVLVALGYAHAQGVIHRDLKPGNIWLSGPISLGRIHAKLVDFGVARIVDSKDFSRMLVGTPAYMAPEQIHGKADGRADLYALAMTLYEALCGQRPYFHNSVDALLIQAMEAIPPPPTTFRPDIPPPIEAWLLKALEKDPDKRFASAEVMRAELAAYKEARSLSSRYGTTRTRKTSALLTAKTPENRWTSFIWAQGPEADRQRLLRLFQEAKATIEQNDSVLIASFGRVTSFGDEARRAVSAALLGRSMHLAVAVFTLHLPSPSLAELEAAAQPELFFEGELRINRETYQLVRGLFDLRSVDGGVYAILGEKPFGAGLRGLLGTEPPLVGRDREKRLLLQIAERFLSEEANEPTLLLGDAGLGKSRLKVELRRALSRQQRPFEYIEGRGDPALQNRPYALFIQALRLGSLDVSDLDGAASAIIESLQELSQGGPVLFVLEDLQWADDASIALLPRLASLEKVWLIGLARPEAAPKIESTFRKRIECWPFSLQDVTAFTKEMVGDNKDLAETLFEISQGNPFLVEETLQGFRDAGLLLHDGDKWIVSGPLRAPTSVGAQWFLQSYLDALSFTEKDLLKRASLFGPRFYAEALESFGTDTKTIPGLVRKGLIFERIPSDVSGAREFLFRHPLLREAAHRLLLPNDEASLHREIARWLSGRELPESLNIAKHLVAAKEPEASAAWYKRAAEEALSRRQNPQAIEFISKAIDLAGESSSLLFSLLLFREELLSNTGQREAALADLKRLTELAQDDESKAQVLFRRGRVLWAQGETVHAKNLLQEGVSLTKKLQSDARTCAYLLLLAEIEASEGFFAPALSLATEARTLAEAKNLPVLVAASLFTSAQLQQRLGDLYRAKLLFEQSLVAARRLHDKSLETRSLSALGAVLLLLGRTASAEEHLQQSASLATRIAQKESLAESRYFLAQIALQKEKPEVAQKLLEEVRLIADTVQHRDLSASCRVLLSFTLLHRGLYEEAVDNAAEALELAPDPWAWALSRAALSLAHLERKNLTAANAHATAALVELQSAIDDASPSPFDFPEDAFWALCDVLQRTKRVSDEARCKEAAQKFFLERAERISDEATRYAFSHRPGHRKLFIGGGG